MLDLLISFRKRAGQRLQYTHPIRTLVRLFDHPGVVVDIISTLWEFSFLTLKVEHLVRSGATFSNNR